MEGGVEGYALSAGERLGTSPSATRGGSWRVLRRRPAPLLPCPRPPRGTQTRRPTHFRSLVNSVQIIAWASCSLDRTPPILPASMHATWTHERPGERALSPASMRCAAPDVMCVTRGSRMCAQNLWEPRCPPGATVSLFSLFFCVWFCDQDGRLPGSAGGEPAARSVRTQSCRRRRALIGFRRAHGSAHGHRECCGLGPGSSRMAHLWGGQGTCLALAAAHGVVHARERGDARAAFPSTP